MVDRSGHAQLGCVPVEGVDLAWRRAQVVSCSLLGGTVSPSVAKHSQRERAWLSEKLPQFRRMITGDDRSAPDAVP
ncbi:hypothetical protein [Streptomyces liliifuscus]|uniref:Uncharacterized protein n=1 Tax=Streptomyces liliifuscus TaxID=2797636 RepID=A0A7T7KUK0_9ACTN|nr:hypothetical protein [Streptomyces liliifuscus]QQM38299.1 hypothetical protein JEQ17_01585 [Streptomyces liliifuscus]